MSARDPLVGAAVAAVVLATAPFGHGGRDPGLLLAHHTLLGLALLGLAWRSPALLLRHRFALAAGLAFALQAFLLSPYRYSTILFLADLGAAFVVYWLAAGSAEDERGPLVVLAGLGAGSLAVLIVGFGEKLGRQPVHGLFTNPNHAGSLAACAGAVSLALATGCRFGPRGRLVLFGAAAAALAFVVVGASKGAALALAAAYVAVLLARRRLRLVLLLGLLLVLGAVLPTPLQTRLVAGKAGDVYVYERLRIWSSAGRLAADHALSGGVGVAAFGKAARSYNFPVETGISRFGKYANVAHCEYLELLAEASVPGLLLLVVPALVALRRAVAGFRAGGPRSDVALPVLAGLTALLVQALVESNLHSPANLYALAALFGIVHPGRGRRGTPVPVPERDPERTAAFRIGLLAAVSLLWWGGVLLPWAGDRAFERYIRSGRAADLERAVALVPGHSGYRVAAGRAAESSYLLEPSLGALEQARSAYGVAARLDRLEAHHFGRRASIAHRAFLGAYPALELATDAVGDYDRAARLDPSNPFREVERAGLLHALGRDGEARAALERAAELEPNCAIAHLLLRSLAVASGDPALQETSEVALRRIAELRRRLDGRGTAYELRLLDATDPGPGGNP